MVIVVFGDFWMISVACAQLSIAVPFMLTRVSPGLIPATAPGAFGVSAVHFWDAAVAATTQVETLPMVVLTAWMPNPLSTTAKSTTAITRFMKGPASMMTMRFQIGSR